MTAVTGERARDLVLDLGANDGHFSRLALDAGARYVVAVDADPLVVDTLYRTLRDEGNERILPLTMNLADPSPGTGWRGVERQPFLGRGRPDLVLALAVIHHLAIIGQRAAGRVRGHGGRPRRRVGGRVPRPPTTRWSRAAAQQARRRARRLHGRGVRAGGRARFDVRRREVLPSQTRMLYHLAPRPG